MRKLFFSLLILALTSKGAAAQINVNVNVGQQRQWGPTRYSTVDYYYLPAIESYYYVPRKQFICREQGRWVYMNKLPARYRHYNLHNGYKVIVNRPAPYRHFEQDRIKYGHYKYRKAPHPKAGKYHPHHRYKTGYVASGSRDYYYEKKDHKGKGNHHRKGKH